MSASDASISWNTLLLDVIRKEISGMRELQRTLEEKKEMFDNMRTRV